MNKLNIKNIEDMVENKNLAPSRVCFNFLEKCNMSCPFCYCEFNGQESNLKIWKSIIAQTNRWKVESITFGAGDPFIYNDFIKLLNYTYKIFEKNIFIQVDSNGLCIKQKYLPTILKTISLLGLPLEGSSPKVHGLMRGDYSHFYVILNLLELFKNQNMNLKINTVVCQQNINDLENIGHLITRYSIKLWSLYEFWALGTRGYKNKNIYEIEHEVFMKKTKSLKEKLNDINIEIGTISSRFDSYFFISQTGLVYTINNENPNQYIELGEIFDSNVLLKWREHSDFRKNRMRYISRKNILN